MLGELIVRFVVGGVLVSLFALGGDLFSPKSFAGLFAAAPSVSLATMALSLHKHGTTYVAIEGRSMIAGAVAFFVYATSLSLILHRRRVRPTSTTLAWLPVWFGVAAVAFALVLRRP